LPRVRNGKGNGKVHKKAPVVGGQVVIMNLQKNSNGDTGGEKVPKASKEGIGKGAFSKQKWVGENNLSKRDRKGGVFKRRVTKKNGTQKKRGYRNFWGGKNFSGLMKTKLGYTKTPQKTKKKQLTGIGKRGVKKKKVKAVLPPKPTAGHN